MSEQNFELIANDLSLDGAAPRMVEMDKPVCITAISPTNPDANSVRCLPQKTEVSGNFQSKCFEQHANFWK
tara:strand:- start:716 stop:928 length:213 start_codon:yes stop_codon:yes gene_type:complete